MHPKRKMSACIDTIQMCQIIIKRWPQLVKNEGIKNVHVNESLLTQKPDIKLGLLNISRTMLGLLQPVRQDSFYLVLIF